MQDFGNATTAASVPISTVCPQAGAFVAGFGTAFSEVGTVLELVNDFFENNTSVTKVVQKVTMYKLSNYLKAGNTFRPTEKVVNDNFLNGADKLMDHAREQNNKK